MNEAISFYHNKGNTRKMDNYYDTIKVLSVYNMNMYQPKAVTIENLDIKIPDIASTIQISRHPLQGELYDLLYGLETVRILSLHSEIVDIITEKTWECHSVDVDVKAKEKVLTL